MIKTEFERWCHTVTDSAICEELEKLKNSSAELEDAFYRHLEFGTGGLRGVLGAGTNRMNIYSVRRASIGLAKYLLQNGGKRIAIGYDTRINSKLFADTAAVAFASLGIEVLVYSSPLPTPMLSFAIRVLACDAGVMITASHNPSKYNGYKVYGSDGCQITDTAAAAILSEISSVDYFEELSDSFESLENKGKIRFIDDSILDSFIEKVREKSQLFGEEQDKSIRITYTPLNGTGCVPIVKILRESGYENIEVVKEQAMPDGNFPTCPYPNPEIPEAIALGLEYAKKYDSDVLLATDPDSDRVGVAVKYNGVYKLLTGNEVGILLLNYICEQRKKHNKMPENPVAVKTIVTTDLSKSIARKYGVKVVDVLTGFKYIGEEIGRLEATNRSENFIFGFEESCGYLGGDYVRDKDGVYAAFLVTEMAAYYRNQGITLSDKLNSIYFEHGYSKSSLYSYSFEGASGYEKMQKVMTKFRGGIASFDGISVVKTEDYINGLGGLPKSNVIKFFLENSASIVVRPSGTEPKLKIYLSVTAECEKQAGKLTEKLRFFAEKIICE